MRKSSTLIYLVVCVIFVVATLSLTGCGRNEHTEINKQFSGVDVELGISDKKVVDKLGEGEVSPCVAGYERNYPDTKLNIGFDQSAKTVRRITLKSDKYSWAEIKSGQTVKQGQNRLTSLGFKQEAGSKVKYLKEDYRVTLTSFKGEIIDEIVIEIKQ